MSHESFEKDSIRKNRSYLNAAPRTLRPGSFIKQTFYKKGELCVTPACGTILRETNPTTLCSICITRGAERPDVQFASIQDGSFEKLIRKLGGRMRKPLQDQKAG